MKRASRFGVPHLLAVMILKSCIGNRSLGWDLLPPGSERFEAGGKVYAGYTYTHIYHGAYGSPEVDQTTAHVTQAVHSADGLSVMVHLEKITEDHIHDFNLAKITSQDGLNLVHNRAYYTVNEIPKN